jgi:L-ascorbate metabolism protein UlaG (beta-lactamase superfamily)
VRRACQLILVAASLAAAAGAARAAAPPDSLQLRHVQNAGVWIAHGERSLLVDALFDLTVQQGRPPRLHDHLPADSLAAFLAGRLVAGCVDAAFATHGHDDHHGEDAARRYRDHCPDTPLVLPAALAPEADGVVPVSLAFGAVRSGEVGPIRYTALGLRHGDDRDERPHLGYVVHLGPWEVTHLGDASLSAANLATLGHRRGRGRQVVLAPWWFVTEEAGRSWLREGSAAELVVLLHVNRGNRGDVEQAVARHAAALPPIVLPRRRLERVALAD